MRASLTAFAFATAAAIASAGNVYVDNLCNYTTYLSSVQGFGPPGDILTLDANRRTAYQEVQRGPGDFNNTIYLSGDAGLNNSLIFGYSQNNNGVLYYSFVTTTGDFFAADGFEVLSNGPDSTALICPPRGEGCACDATRTVVHQDSPVEHTVNGYDFTVRLCSSDGIP
ncbi:MAG: hypothetical protein Q9162_002415 [Coniocarpon cinnabarinum]